jgi:alkanesulfonate monooxygenase SsuD/methylene tetrahydromethanopterin reductase-like flavin-dependent oxidoreductase (luciferase family)
LGHIVLCAAYPNAALTAKMISTLDVISGGRADLGLDAGWKRDEWRGYGYGIPDAPERLAVLKDRLEIVSAMLNRDRATYRGAHRHVDGAINNPAPLQPPRIPIAVGGNGPNLTWRLAARYADELSVDGMSADELRQVLPTIRARTEEIGRDPDSPSWADDCRAGGAQLVDTHALRASALSSPA